jgi:ABC-type polysaccharide/polyol phosphate export permease
MQKVVSQWRVFFHLLHRDWHVLRAGMFNRSANGVVWGTLVIWVSGYIFPRLGMFDSYGVFMLAGAIFSQGIYQAMAEVAILLSDLSGDQHILYCLALPLSPSLVYLRYAITSGLKGLFVGLVALTVGSIVLFPHLHLMNIIWWKALLVFFIITSFCGAFSLAVAAVTRDFLQYEDVWARFTFPLWFLGGSGFPWFALHKAVPLMSSVVLLNPMLHAMEASRAALLGQDGFLPFQLSCLYLVLWTVILGCWAVRCMRRRLDTL